MLTLFYQGGAMMIPLLLCSTFVGYLIIWKLISLWIYPLKHITYFERVQNLLLTQGRELTIQTLRASRKTQDRLVSAVLASIDLPRDEAQDHIRTASREVEVQLDRGVQALHSMVSIAPMVGLLGTVLGLMEIFRGIAHVASGDMTQLYSGISIALINTVFGLGIAIVSGVFYQLFSQSVESAIAKVDANLMALLAFCRQNGK
jgi:biopolymer transport protein ExbB